MGDALASQGVERLVQGQRIGRGQRAIDGARRRDHADRAQRGGLEPAEGENLAGEIGDRGLAAGAGHGDDGFGLAWIKRGGGLRQAGADVANRDEGRVRQRPLRRPFADNGDGARRERLRRELQPVGLGAGDGEEQETRRDGAAVGGKAGHLQGAEGVGSAGQQGVEPHQCSPATGVAGVLAKP